MSVEPGARVALFRRPAVFLSISPRQLSWGESGTISLFSGLIANFFTSVDPKGENHSVSSFSRLLPSFSASVEPAV